MEWSEVKRELCPGGKRCRDDDARVTMSEEAKGCQRK